jgi:hypothetical protein
MKIQKYLLLFLFVITPLTCMCKEKLFECKVIGGYDDKKNLNEKLIVKIFENQRDNYLAIDVNGSTDFTFGTTSVSYIDKNEFEIWQKNKSKDGVVNIESKIKRKRINSNSTYSISLDEESKKIEFKSVLETDNKIETTFSYKGVCKLISNT